MDPVATVTQSSQLIAQMLQMSLATELDLQEKLLKFAAEMQIQLSSDAMRGQAMDILA